MSVRTSIPGVSKGRSDAQPHPQGAQVRSGGVAVKSLRRLSAAAAGLTFLLVAVGGVVRATESGLACPDWPTCHGRFYPPLEYHAVIEYSHRTLAMLVGLCILSLAIVALRRRKVTKGVARPAVAALAVVVFQGGLGRLVVRSELDNALVVVHLITAMVLIVLLEVVAVRVRWPKTHALERGFSRLAAAGVVITAALLIAGGAVTQADAGLAFADWPLMAGRIFPDMRTTPALIHFVHRLLAGVAGIIYCWLALRAWQDRRHRLILGAALSALGLFLAQVAAGAANVWTLLSEPAIATHVSLSSLTWGSIVFVALVSRRLEGRVRADDEPGSSSVARAYVELTKPRIIVLLLVTTVPAMVVAQRGWPSTLLIISTLFGGFLSAAGANAINCYLDRDIDEAMGRTQSRPLPSHRVGPVSALRFGILLGCLGFGWLWVVVNPLAAALSTAALLFYVFVYTMWLKRGTPQNIVIGGAAGAMPAMVGWAAVTGRVQMPAVVLFLIIFCWTPPHFWALALRHADDYAKANVPMLPVVRGVTETTRQILIYSFVVVAVTLAFFPVGGMGVIYLAAAVGLGVRFVQWAFKLRRDPRIEVAMGMFRFSIVYLGLLFAAMALDTIFIVK